MPEIFISPVEARSDCNVGITLDHVRSVPKYGQTINVYKFSAREGGNWKFVGFEWDLIEKVDWEWGEGNHDHSEQTIHHSILKSRCRYVGDGLYDVCFDEPNYPITAEGTWDYSETFPLGDVYHETGSESISNLRAVFEYVEPPPEFCIVTTSVHPERAGTSSGGGQYRKGSNCTISTTPKCSPWKFDHWELTPGGTVRSRQHTFTVNQDTTCVAHYTHTNTGQPYYDADGGGEILCTPGGAILYDGAPFVKW